MKAKSRKWGEEWDSEGCEFRDRKIAVSTTQWLIKNGNLYWNLCVFSPQKSRYEHREKYLKFHENKVQRGEKQGYQKKMFWKTHTHIYTQWRALS